MGHRLDVDGAVWRLLGVRIHEPDVSHHAQGPQEAWIVAERNSQGVGLRLGFVRQLLLGDPLLADLLSVDSVPRSLPIFDRVVFADVGLGAKEA